jgi:hypothetical protein
VGKKFTAGKYQGIGNNGKNEGKIGEFHQEVIKFHIIKYSPYISLIYPVKYTSMK